MITYINVYIVDNLFTYIETPISLTCGLNLTCFILFKVEKKLIFLNLNTNQEPKRLNVDKGNTGVVIKVNNPRFSGLKLGFQHFLTNSFPNRVLKEHFKNK